MVRQGTRKHTHKNQGGVKILIVLLHVFGVVLRRLSSVHGVEIELGVVVLDRLKVHPQGFLDAELESACNLLCFSKRTIWGRH